MEYTFKNKPVLIKAIQLTKNTVHLCYNFIGKKGNFPECGVGIDPADGQFKITIHKNIYIVNLKDYLIKDKKGKLYVLKPDSFKATFKILKKDYLTNVSFYFVNKHLHLYHMLNN